MRSFFAFYFVYFLLCHATSWEIVGKDLISLYPGNSKITELNDTTLAQAVYNSPQIWVVEFYAHWCGHCQKFVKIWKKIAEEFYDWRDVVRIGVINCAQQSRCNDFNINGVPTIRIFYPGITSGFGIDIPHSMDLSYNRGEILKAVQVVQSQQQVAQIQKRRNLLPYNLVDLGSIIQEAFPAKKVVFVIEGLLHQFGREIVFLAGKIFPDFYVRRIDWTQISSIHRHFQSEKWPAVLALNIVGNTIDWDNVHVFYPIVTVEKHSLTKQVLEFLNTIKSSTGLVQEVKILTNDETTIPATVQDEPMLDAEPKDVVHMVDLEQSIRYALTTEIPIHQFLDEEQMKAIFQYLEVIVRYLPLRQNLLYFLKALRDWPVQMDLKVLRSADFVAKVNELMELYKPFEETPNEWMACKGSQPHLRGYPCSVWTLFHALTVNAALKGDPSMAVGGKSSVASAMVGYIHHFFTCRPCAENFVNHLGVLPTTPNASILWLWQVHNIANAVLKGEPSEDPKHPKILWPSPVNCPDCRNETSRDSSTENEILLTQGESWNVRATTDYIIKTYKAENIVRNPKEKKSKTYSGAQPALEDKAAQLQALMELTMSRIQSQEGRMVIDIKSLLAINQYCAKAMALVNP